MKTYNGFKNWNHWNVSLWINNDESLYHMAARALSIYPRKEAARALLDAFNNQGITHTPDGAKYSVSAIYSAIEGI